MDLAAEIRAEMARQEISGLDLARRIGMGRSTLNRKTGGESKITIPDLERIGAGLSVEPWELMRRASEAAAHRHDQMKAAA